MTNRCWNQDRSQQFKVGIAFLVEMYRVMIGTCLIFFVPQQCGTNVCGFTTNLFIGKPLYDFAFYLNIFTLASFLALYGIEMYREKWLIHSLEVNPTIPNENEAVGKRIQALDTYKRIAIYRVDTIYISCAYYCMVCFSTNTVLSGFVILNHIDNKTITGFITNILFMILKLGRIHMIINTDKNIFYSAYLMDFVQFNDLDPKEKELLKKKEEELQLWQSDWVSIKGYPVSEKFDENRDVVDIYL